MTTRPTQKIGIVDDLHPEDLAMVQAMYSRSPATYTDHLAKVAEVGSGKFMSQYYVGYGHQSIGDCGNTTVFIEQVSMLVTKAFQDNPLYSGQEASTRYLDFKQQAVVDPYDHPASRAILDGWMALYNASLPKVIAALELKHPYAGVADDLKERTKWLNAIKARAFDICRGLLPIGTTTLFSWTTNLRQARDQLRRLKFHPLPEVRQVARDVHAALLAKYPNSFKPEDMVDHRGTDHRYAARDAYLADNAMVEHFVDWKVDATPDIVHRVVEGVMFVNHFPDDLKQVHQTLLTNRPAGAEVPRVVAEAGTAELTFALDFGSFRDIQRHRNGVCQIPLVDVTLGMHPWYMAQLDDLLGDGFMAVHDEVYRLLAAIDRLHQHGVAVERVLNSYLYPMGINCYCKVAYSIPQMVYVAELRSGATVHPTLRPVAQKMGDVLLEHVPDMALYVDDSDDQWSLKRGDQTITAKAS